MLDSPSSSSTNTSIGPLCYECSPLPTDNSCTHVAQCSLGQVGVNMFMFISWPNMLLSTILCNIINESIISNNRWNKCLKNITSCRKCSLSGNLNSERSIECTVRTTLFGNLDRTSKINVDVSTCIDSD